MKWLLFVTELLLLFVTFNALFMLPGPFGWFNVIVTCIGLSLSAICAWYSGRKFVEFTKDKQARLRDVAGTLPGGVWIPLALIYTLRVVQLAASARTQ